MLTSTWFSLGLVVLITAFVVLAGMMSVLMHVYIDTIGLVLIYFNQDAGLKKLLWKEKV